MFNFCVGCTYLLSTGFDHKFIFIMCLRNMIKEKNKEKIENILHNSRLWVFLPIIL